MIDISDDNKKTLYRAVVVLLIILSLYFVVKIMWEFRSYNSMSTSTISLSGYGEVQAVPDIANIYFTITKESKMVKDAQDMVAEVEKSAIDMLKENGVAEKDFKATNASFYPKYEYQSESGVRLPCNQWGCPPSTGKQVIVGYEASESITVKVRNTDDVGKIMQGLGTLGVTNLSGPNFAIDDEEALKMEARREAIKDAKEKAKVLARDLGVHLGRIASFQEDGGYYPVMYKTEASNMAIDSSATGAPATLPTGENTISSTVTIMYEIK